MDGTSSSSVASARSYDPETKYARAVKMVSDVTPNLLAAYLAFAVLISDSSMVNGAYTGIEKFCTTLTFSSAVPGATASSSWSAREKAFCNQITTSAGLELSDSFSIAFPIWWNLDAKSCRCVRIETLTSLLRIIQTQAYNLRGQ